MYCPKCGQSDQKAESFCRKCGLFLPDLSKPVKQSGTPQEHILANTVLSSMTIGACVVLAVLLYIFVAFRPDTHPLIYVTCGLLIAMAAWHTQTLWRTLQLRKHFRKNEERRLAALRGNDMETGKLLEQADLDEIVPNSVTERTTRSLSGSRTRSS